MRSAGAPGATAEKALTSARDTERRETGTYSFDRVRRTALIALLLALALAAAGCGAATTESDDAVETDGQAPTETETGTETEETDATEQEGAPIAASQVVQEFLAVESAQLEEAAGSDPAWEQLGLGLNPTPQQQKRYGTFSIYVVKPGRDEAVDSLLTDKETAEPLQADSSGIYWDYDELSRSYIAHKQYGPNVVVAWWNEKGAPGVDVRWRRLDALMQSVVDG